MDTEILSQAIVLYLILVISIGIHEWGHAFVADKLGDMTPRSQGRVTLNPIAHMDVIGTGILPALMLLPPVFGAPMGFMIIGWGKPVMVDIRSFKNQTRDHLLVTAAGPICNLLLALVATIVGSICIRFMGNLDDASRFLELIQGIISLNVFLAVFNMIPIPPLDGSHFLKYAVNMSEEMYFKLSQWGFLILIVLINTPFFRIIEYVAALLYKPYIMIMRALIV